LVEQIKERDMVKQRNKIYYKIANPDGWDFYTGKTINYRDNIGKVVVCPDYDKNGDLCSSAFLHASKKPDQCFIGGRIPCSVYKVSGIPIKEEEDKSGFGQLKIIKELNPEQTFKWNYKEACNPVHPFKIKPPKITKNHIELVKKWGSVRVSVSVWVSVWDSVRVSVGYSVGYSVRDSVRDSVWDSVRDSVRDSVWVSVWVSVWDSVYAYIGYMFKDVIKEWKYTKKIKYKKGQYPFQPAVDLWKLGLVPSYDGKIWRLHGGKKAKVLWEGNIK